MNLLFRFKNEKKSVVKEGTMESHIAICRRYGKVFWGQYSNNEKTKRKYISDEMLDLLYEADDKRIVFFDSKTEYLYVGMLEDIYRREDSIPIEEMSNYVPEYYREELKKGKDSKVAVWVGISDLNRVDDPMTYLDKVYSYKKGPEGGSIISSFNGQTTRFYVINNNEREITLEEYEISQDRSVNGGIEDEDSLNFEDERNRKLQSVVVRKGQQKFRKEVLEFFKRKCCISNCNVYTALEAAHIIPYKGEKSNIIENGLCLRADIHKLWDEFLISINPKTYKVEISSVLLGTEYEKFNNKTVFKDLDKKDIRQEQALDKHYKECKLYK